MWDLTRLRLLHELRLRGTITAVAQSLNYSPSSVSQQLAKLESEVGVPLLEPDGRRVRLTARGHQVARHARRVIDLEEAVRAEITASSPAEETIRVATLETAARALLPHALTRLREVAPHLRIEASVVPPEEGLAELEARTFDLAMAEQYPGRTRRHRAELDRRSFGTDVLRLTVPPGSGIRTLADAATMPWVLEPAGTVSREWALQQCRAAGFEPDVRFDATDLDVHVQLVHAGHAVGLLPDLVWSGPRSGRSLVELVDLPEDAHRDLFTSVRRATMARPTIRAVRAALGKAFEAVRIEMSGASAQHSVSNPRPG